MRQPIPIPLGIAPGFLLESVRVLCGATDAGGVVKVLDEAANRITPVDIPCDTANEVNDAINLNAARVGIVPDTTLSVVYSGGSAGGRGTVYLTLIPRAL